MHRVTAISAITPVRHRRSITCAGPTRRSIVVVSRMTSSAASGAR
jgi:hypothetical protein